MLVLHEPVVEVPMLQLIFKYYKQVTYNVHVHVHVPVTWKTSHSQSQHSSMKGNGTTCGCTIFHGLDLYSNSNQIQIEYKQIN